MGSGHTHRKGRGNQRRARNGPPRPAPGAGQNGYADSADQPQGHPASAAIVAPRPTQPVSGQPPRTPQAGPLPPSRPPGASAQNAHDVAPHAPAEQYGTAPQQSEPRAAAAPASSASSARPPFEPRHHVPGARSAPTQRWPMASEPAHEARNGHAREVSASPVSPGRRSGPLGPGSEVPAHEARHSVHHATYTAAEGFAVNERVLGQPDVRGDVGPLIDALKELFQHDRATASTGSATRCGVCYLHFPLAELVYREAEGFYVCSRCAQAIGAARIPMVRRQKRL